MPCDLPSDNQAFCSRSCGVGKKLIWCTYVPSRHKTIFIFGVKNKAWMSVQIYLCRRTPQQTPSSRHGNYKSGEESTRSSPFSETIVFHCLINLTLSPLTLRVQRLLAVTYDWSRAPRFRIARSAFHSASSVAMTCITKTSEQRMRLVQSAVKLILSVASSSHGVTN